MCSLHTETRPEVGATGLRKPVAPSTAQACVDRAGKDFGGLD